MYDIHRTSRLSSPGVFHMHSCYMRAHKTTTRFPYEPASITSKVRFISNQSMKLQGPVVQSVVSLTSSLRVISLTVLADSIYNTLIFFAEKM